MKGPDMIADVTMADDMVSMETVMEVIDMIHIITEMETDMEVVIEMTVVTELTTIVRNLQQNMVLVDTMSFSIDGRSDISQNTSVKETLTLCCKNV